MNENSAELPLGIEIADEDRQSFRRCAELSGIEKRRTNIGANIEDLVGHGALASRHEVKHTQISEGGHNTGGDKDRNRELRAAVARGTHDHELRIRTQARKRS